MMEKRLWTAYDGALGGPDDKRSRGTSIEDLGTEDGLLEAEFYMEQRLVGWIIGRSGSTLKEVEQAYNVKITVDQSTKDDGYSKVKVSGQAAHVQQAAEHMNSSLARAVVGRNDGGESEAAIGPFLMDTPPGPGPDMYEELHIEQRFVGWLLGKGGTVVREIEMQSGCKVSLNQGTRSMGFTVAQLHGDVQQRAVARQLMEASLERARTTGTGGSMNPGEQDLQVEQRWVGWLLGKGGGLAREIEQESGARITIDQSTKSLGYSTVKIAGEATAVELAKARIAASLQKVGGAPLAVNSSSSSHVAAAAPLRGASGGGGGGWLGSLFGKSAAPAKPAKPAPASRLVPQGPRGLYVHGGCGTGKTFLMDLFYDAVPVAKKKRIHFHEWMIDVHERLHRLQKSNAMVKEKANTVWTAEHAKAQREQLKAGSRDQRESADDLVVKVASEMMNEAWLLCFDEFQVTHISDAIIMKRLFSVLFEQGAVILATSNRPPEDLYLNGLNRPLFTPFIPMLKDFCEVYDIDSETDYRLTTTGEEEDRRVYIAPNGKEEKKLLERKFYRICHGQVLTGVQVETQGRRIVVPKSAVNSNVAWFSFPDLCDRPLGAADYLAIASAFHTVFISNIPKLTLQERDQVRRFITLIDAFYERHTKLVCTADRDPINLFEFSEDERQNSTFDEIFAWDRTASRLIEMQSVKYLSEYARRIDGEQFLGQFNIKALSDEDLAEMWRRYDRDESGEIDQDELRVMLEDILEKHKGHRDLSHEVFKICMEQIDTDNNGSVSYDEFVTYLADFSTLQSTIRI
mmetsp:Transcript_109865/g.342444  ORF Transcript_109865/g.342444 Transcript_109865/m.342444 type:complete len:799 (-) Transcript_109865:75-2471(-)